MKNQNNKYKNFINTFEDNCISLKKFMINYCGVYNESLYKHKLSHKDIKDLFPNLKRVSFEYVEENKIDVYNGNILIVKDSYDAILPYYNPKIEIKEFFNINIEENKENLEEFIISENLNNYELATLCKKLKMLKRYKEYRVAYNILRSHKDVIVEKYKKEKLDLTMKGRFEND